MKKIFLSLSITAGSLCLSAQSTLPNNGTNGDRVTNAPLTSNNSNSGVNPNGNPGTIISITATSQGSGNRLLQPSAPPPVPVYHNTNRVTPNTIATNPGVSATTTTTVSESRLPVNSTITTGEITEPADRNITINTSNTTIVSGTVKPGLTQSTGSPQLTTWVSDEILNKLRKKFGNGLYDVTMLKTKVGNQNTYIVRIQKDGVYTTQVLTEADINK
jgi:hypothetical protein